MFKSIVMLFAAGIALAAGQAPERNKPLAQFHDKIARAGTGDAALIPGLERDPVLRPYGAIWQAARWPRPGIAVCWENPGQADAQAMAWTRDAVQRTWEKASKVRFTGWQKCAAVNKGIRIRIADEGPRVETLGRFLDGMKNGMVLNFTFDNWGYNCQTARENCIRAIAVHEFGHAIGLTHEQNRADTPGECKLLAQGTLPDVALTPFDVQSVMNYCNKNWTDGMLSQGDIDTVVKIYGAP